MIKRWAPPLALAAAAAAYLYLCALRHFIFQLCMAYTAGVAILHGGWPYRDLLFPVGPLTFLLQAPFFKLFGVSYAGGFLAHSAALNAAVTVLIYAWARRRGLGLAESLGAAALTAVWNYPMSYGMPNYDQEAFCFALAAAALIPAQAPRETGARLRGLAAGLCAGLAFWAKQSTGGAALVLLGLFALAVEDWKGVALFVAGAALANAGMVGLLCWKAQPAVLWHQFIVLPLSAGRMAFVHRPAFWAAALAAALLAAAWPALSGDRWLALPLGPALAAPLFTSPLFFLFFAPMAVLSWLRRREDKIFLCLLCLLQLGARLASLNDIRMFWPLLGLQFVLAAQPLLERFRAEAVVVWTFLLALGVRLSYGAGVASLFPGTTVLAALAALALALLLRPRRAAWSALCAAACVALGARAALAYVRRRVDPAAVALYLATRPSARSPLPQLRHLRMRESEERRVDSLVSALQSLPPDRRPFFIFPWCDMAYPLVGQDPPQPVLWFDPGLSFRPGDGTDALVARALRKAGVRTIVTCLDYRGDVVRTLPAIQALEQGPPVAVPGEPTVALYGVKPPS